jgi:SAM-dependent methyltransferase
MSLREALPRPLINALRAVRQTGYVALTPLDYVSRRMNGKSDFPPLHLRRHVGPLRTFEASGAEFTVYLQTLAGFRPTHRVLDIGCGCGLMALYLRERLAPGGSYTGTDVHAPSIRWCTRHITREFPAFTFHHTDIRSLAYNPTGKLRGDEFSFAFPDASFDVLLLKSVFTHVWPAEVDNYLREIARLLDRSGRCLATFFLLNDEQQRLAEGGRNAFEFKYGDDVWRYVYQNSPESVAAYRESHVRSAVARAGLEIESVRYGSWSGRDDGLSFQDILLLRKA